MARQLKPVQIALALVGVNFVWRLLWLPVSQGAYTDAILQITAFQHGLTFWPPLYTALAYILGWIPLLGLEGSARLISIIAGSLTVLPLEAMARRLFGARAAMMAVLLYTISPIPLRWSLQPQTDATFMALWMASLASLILAARAIWPALYEQTKEKPKGDAKSGTNWLLAASLAGVAASLTRYQGILLLPLIIAVIVRFGKTKAEFATPPKFHPLLTLIPWAVPLVWLVGALNKHVSQMVARTSSSLSQTLLDYLYYFEQFVLVGPYFIGYGIFGFFLYGLFRVNFATKRIAQSVIAAGYLTLGLLIMHSIFSAYQSRYLLPVVPFIVILAGHGMAVWEKHCEKHRGRFFALAIPTLGHALIFSALVAFYQGNPFIDLKQAGKFVKANVPEDARIFSNETYNAEIGSAKLQYWSGGRKIERFEFGAPQGGDYIVLSSFYGAATFSKEIAGPGGWTAYQSVKDALLDRKAYAQVKNLKEQVISQFPAKEVKTFAYASLPLLPDIMMEPFTHTNPLAWYLRYRTQLFETSVLRVLTVEEAMQEEEKVKEEGKKQAAEAMSSAKPRPAKKPATETAPAESSTEEPKGEEPPAENTPVPKPKPASGGKAKAPAASKP